MQVSVPLFAALATVVAALITAAVALVALILAKEQKTSEFRQAWIDGLRVDLTQYFAASRAISRAMQELHAFGEKEDGQRSTRITNISELRTGVASNSYGIKLRLNANEPEHIKLEELMCASAERVSALMQGTCTADEALLAVEIASDQARKILKTEWKRVKQGESPYRATVDYLQNFVQRAPLLVVLLVILYAIRNCPFSD